MIDEVDAECGGGVLYWAIVSGYLHFVDPLIEAGADVNKPDKRKITPVYIAAERGYVDVIRTLQAAGANVNTPNNGGVTPVYVAARHGHAETITTLKALGANVDTSDKDGETPVYIAACHGHAAAIAALKAAGANVDMSAKNGVTPLCMAASMGYVEAVNALLEAGANANINTRDGTALERGQQGQNPGCLEVVRLLKAHLRQYPNGIKQIASVLPAATNLAPKNTLNQKAEQTVENLMPEVCRYDNVVVEAKAKRDIATVVGGIRGDGEIVIGGGNTSNSVETGSSSDSNPKEAVEVDNIAVLKKLKLFFMSNKYKGLESQDCELYNSVLERHKAMLVYLEDEHIHKLFINDEPLEPQNAIKKITQIIESLQPLSTQSVGGILKASSLTTSLNDGGTRVQGRAGRDVITFTGSIVARGPVRIGGGDTHRTFTAYDQFKNQNASKYYSSLGNGNGNIQLSIRAEIFKAIKFTNHLKI